MKARWYQSEAVQSIFDLFELHPGENVHPLICLPTGTGKSLIPALFIKQAMWAYPKTRAMLLTHVAPLISQNAKAMLRAWPQAPLGVYSAGLRKRNHESQIVFGGVMSVKGKFPIFGYRDFLFVDECHLIGNDGTYLEVIADLQKTNPYLKVIGLSATPYRMGMGLLTNGKIFTHITYDMCNIEGFARLIAEGFLCPLISPGNLKTKLDVSGVPISKGDFNEAAVQAAVDKRDITFAALSESMPYFNGRNSVLVFAAGVEHANHIGEMLSSVFNINNVILHSKRTDTENAASMEAWRTGKVNVAVSMNMLTTGVDHAPLDLIIDLQPTASTGKHVQKYGRGTRPYDYRVGEQYIQGFDYTKDNCLCLDFAGNTVRNGPINDPVIPRLKGGKLPGDAPVKICPACGFYNHARATECLVCGEAFSNSPDINRIASDALIMRSDAPVIETWNVRHMVLTEHKSKAGNLVVKVQYYCDDFNTFTEYMSLETNGIWTARTRQWFRQRYKYRVPVSDLASVNTLPNGELDDVPNNNADLIALHKEYRWPARIKVWTNHKPMELIGVEF